MLGSHGPGRTGRGGRGAEGGGRSAADEGAKATAVDVEAEAAAVAVHVEPEAAAEADVSEIRYVFTGLHGSHRVVALTPVQKSFPHTSTLQLCPQRARKAEPGPCSIK